MLNVEETIDLVPSYLKFRDIGLRAISFGGGSVFALEALRGQVAEIKLLQLVPGLYFGLLIITYFLLIIFSEIFVRIPFEYDRQKKSGTKSLLRLDQKMNTKFSFTFYTFGLFFILGIIVPLSVECFTSSTEKTLETLWSFEDLNRIEAILFSILTCLFQVPLILTRPSYSEQKIRFFNFSFKAYLLFSSIFAGFITPTVDVITQLAFTIVGVLFYRFSQVFFQRQILLKIESINLL